MSYPKYLLFLKSLDGGFECACCELSIANSAFLLIHFHFAADSMLACRADGPLCSSQPDFEQTNNGGDVGCMLTGTVYLLTTYMQDFPGTIFTK
jgi:hypothetical protein